MSAAATRPDRARLVQGLADLGPGRAGPGRRLAPRPPRRRDPALPAGRRRRGHARRDRGGRRLAAPDLDGPRSARSPDHGALAALGRRPARGGRDGRGLRPLALLTADERDPIRATSIGTGDLIRAALDARRQQHRPGHRRQRHDGRRRRPADRPRGPCRPGHRARSISPTSIRGSRPSSCRWPATSRTPCAGRPGPRPSTARRRARRPTTSQDLDRRLGRFADSMELVGGRSRAHDPGRRRGRRRRVRAALDPGPVPVVRAPPGRRPRDGRHRLRRAARAGRPRHHRRGPDRCPDRLRQDRARGRAPRPGGGRTLHRSRWRRRARRHRRPSRRSVRSPSR